MILFELTHARADDEYRDHEKRIGVYSTREKAEAAQQRVSDKPGFRDWAAGFEIREIEVDLDSWVEGFISWDEAVPPK